MRSLTYKRSRIHHELARLEALHQEASVDLKNLEQELSCLLPCLSDGFAPNLSSLIVLDTIQCEQETISGIIIKIPTAIRFKAISLPKLFTPVWLVRAKPKLEEYAHRAILVAFLATAMGELNKELTNTTIKLRSLFYLRATQSTQSALTPQATEWV